MKRLLFTKLTSCKEYEFKLFFKNDASNKVVTWEKKSKTYYKWGDLELTVTANKNMVEWSLPARDCVGLFKLSVSKSQNSKPIFNSNIKKDQSSFKLTKLDSCEKYFLKLQVEDFRSKVLEVVNKTFQTSGLTEKISNLISNSIKISPSSHMVKISWDKFDSTCVTEFVAEIERAGSKETKKMKHNDTEVEFFNLEACQDYQMTLKIKYKSNKLETVQKNFTTSTREPTFAVNVEASVQGTEVNITWDPPKLGKYCVSEYLVGFTEHSCLKENNETWGCWENRTIPRDLQYFTETFVPCHKYSYFVYPQPIVRNSAREIIDSYENYVQKILDFELETETLEAPTNLRILEISPSELKLMWSPTGENVACQIQQSFKVNVNEEVYSTELEQINLPNLMPCRTNYTVNIYATDQHGRTSEPLTTILDMDRNNMSLSEVKNLTYKITGQEALFTWDVENLEDKCTLYYKIRINGNQEFEETKGHSFLLKGLISCVPYSVQIIPISLDLEEGVPVTVDIKTPPVGEYLRWSGLSEESNWE